MHPQRSCSTGATSGRLAVEHESSLACQIGLKGATCVVCHCVFFVVLTAIFFLCRTVFEAKSEKLKWDVEEANSASVSVTADVSPECAQWALYVAQSVNCHGWVNQVEIKDPIGKIVLEDQLLSSSTPAGQSSGRLTSMCDDRGHPWHLQDHRVAGTLELAATFSVQYNEATGFPIIGGSYEIKSPEGRFWLGKLCDVREQQDLSSAFFKTYVVFGSIAMFWALTCLCVLCCCHIDVDEGVDAKTARRLSAEGTAFPFHRYAFDKNTRTLTRGFTGRLTPGFSRFSIFKHTSTDASSKSKQAKSRSRKDVAKAGSMPSGTKVQANVTGASSIGKHGSTSKMGPVVSFKIPTESQDLEAPPIRKVATPSDGTATPTTCMKASPLAGVEAGAPTDDVDGASADVVDMPPAVSEEVPPAGPKADHLVDSVSTTCLEGEAAEEAMKPLGPHPVGSHGAAPAKRSKKPQKGTSSKGRGDVSAARAQKAADAGADADEACTEHAAVSDATIFSGDESDAVDQANRHARKPNSKSSSKSSSGRGVGKPLAHKSSKKAAGDVSRSAAHPAIAESPPGSTTTSDN